MPSRPSWFPLFSGYFSSCCNGRYGMVTMCVGGGMSTAGIF
ncbi:MAG TPA: hypothetical protein VGS05_14220 [Candidatus Sulfotelmatobacter sp.]|nr:hypothetical protein [Candidatus Sulfotelmatobacter sp.]